jgi:hypothetical protein
MIHEARISHSRDGYSLVVVEVPLWALTVERAGVWLCEKTGNLACSAGLPAWAWRIGVGRRDEDGSPRWNLGSVLFDFGQWFHTTAARRERQRVSMPVTAEWVERHFPESRIEFLERDSA